MSSAAQEFWIEKDDYHDLARQYERNIESTSPDRVGCCYCQLTHCQWAATTVTYYEYRGPSPSSD